MKNIGQIMAVALEDSSKSESLTKGEIDMLQRAVVDLLVFAKFKVGLPPEESDVANMLSAAEKIGCNVAWETLNEDGGEDSGVITVAESFTPSWEHPGYVAWGCRGSRFDIKATPYHDGSEGIPVQIDTMDGTEVYHEVINCENFTPEEWANFVERYPGDWDKCQDPVWLGYLKTMRAELPQLLAKAANRCE